MATVLADSLKSALCRTQEPSLQLWMFAGKATGYLFEHPAIALLVGLAVVGFSGWLAQRYLRRYLRKRVRRSLVITLLVLGLFFVSPAPSAIGHRLLVGFLPADSGELADAIVVLGRGREQNAVRAASVATLWHAKRAPLVMASGRVDASVIASLLQKQENIPKSFIVQERCSLTTDENAEFTAGILMPRGLDNIILVTDASHMMRSLLTFKSFGFHVIPYLIPFVGLDEVSQGEPYQLSKPSRFLTFRESLGALSYGLMGRYFSRQVSTETIAEADKLIAQQLKKGAATAIEQY